MVKIKVTPNAKTYPLLFTDEKREAKPTAKYKNETNGKISRILLTMSPAGIINVNNIIAPPPKHPSITTNKFDDAFSFLDINDEADNDINIIELKNIKSSNITYVSISLPCSCILKANFSIQLPKKSKHIATNKKIIG